MNKENKAILNRLVTVSVDEVSGYLFAHAEYDVSKLRRMNEDKLEELLFQKTLKAYPFAVINRGLHWNGRYTAYIRLCVFIPQGAVLRRVEGAPA